MEPAEYTVGAVARLTGVSVRTLRHYDETGLLVPGDRSPAGYRLYRPDDLRRLQRILFYRELDIGLDEIAALLDDPSVTDEDHLRRQRDLLRERAERSRSMIAVIDRELTARRAGITLTPAERMEVFGGDRLVETAAEAERRWGHLPEFGQRRERTAAYGTPEWLAARAEQAAIHQGLADAMAAGTPADDPSVTDLAERHRVLLDRWFHDCDPGTHRRLAGEYRANRRLGRNYDDMVPGLSRYVHDAIVANCRRHEAGDRPPLPDGDAGSG